jgi:hypothetical protein
MTAWQYAQLVITRDGRGSEDTQTILWHGARPGHRENLSEGGQTVLELLNRAGHDGWELADREELCFADTREPKQRFSVSPLRGRT